VPAVELALFRANISFARDLAATAVALAGQVTPVMDTDDLLRAALVQGVSAFDHFVHEEVRSRMLGIHAGTQPRVPGFERFRVSMLSVQQALTTDGTVWLESEIREQHGYLSFQHPDKVADAFRLVSVLEFWNAVGLTLGRPAADLRRTLILIVERRNKIAHEADTDPTPPRTRYPINSALVTDSLDFLESIANATQVVL
jgi:hypothetical protein